jgi:hypothetical protein
MAKPKTELEQLFPSPPYTRCGGCFRRRWGGFRGGASAKLTSTDASLDLAKSGPPLASLPRRSGPKWPHLGIVPVPWEQPGWATWASRRAREPALSGRPPLLPFCYPTRQHGAVRERT